MASLLFFEVIIAITNVPSCKGAAIMPNDFAVLSLYKTPRRLARPKGAFGHLACMQWKTEL